MASPFSHKDVFEKKHLSTFPHCGHFPSRELAIRFPKLLLSPVGKAGSLQGHMGEIKALPCTSIPTSVALPEVSLGLAW